ncbi:Hypp148 [Branchiostoma lanceolatum]|uniref:Hypp148 protein n=1 Tax=Branchiostoma lanceolatum TaxID=7740 RepID=A0A8J9VXS6_BRALA|nr:Hypp148 [Branchiostoma lanceolatum]
MQIRKNGADASVNNGQHDMDGREPAAIRRYQNRQPVQQDPTSKDANTPVQIRNGNSGKEEPKEDHGAWGPIFKNRDHFVEMHIC